MPKSRFLKSDRVEFDWTFAMKALLMLSDFEGTSGSKVGQQILMLKEAVVRLVELAERNEQSAYMWSVVLDKWLEWYEMNEQKKTVPNPMDLCVDFDDPKKAADFLTCPPLKNGKVARLINGIDAPQNAYEKYVSKCPCAKESDISIYEENGPMMMYTLRFEILTGDSKRRGREMRELAKEHGFSLLKFSKSRWRVPAFGLKRLIPRLIMKKVTA